MKKISYSGLLLLFSILFLLRSDNFAVENSGADFLNIAVGARPAGLGEAFVAVADETSGMFYNPAGLGFSFSPELQTMYSLWLGDMYYSYMGYHHPTVHGTYGVGLRYLSGPSTHKLVNGIKQGDFSFYNGAANFLYSVRMSEKTSIGLNLQGISSKIDASRVSAFSGDIGFMFRTIEEGFSLGISGQNLFGEMGEDKLPLTTRLGMAFKASLPEHNTDILFTIEAGQAQPGFTYYAAGLEHWGARTLGLRAGYKYIVDEKQRQSLDIMAPWRAGISLRLKSVAVDYSYHPFAVLEAAHRISFTWRTLGWVSKWRMVPAQLKAEPELFSPNGDGAKDSVFFVPTVTEIKDIKNWELIIEDIGHNTVKKFSGKDVLPKILAWEGQLDSGNGSASEGKYFCLFKAEGDGKRRAKSSYGEIFADLTPPDASIQVPETALSPNSDGLDDFTTFYISVTDGHGIDQWRLSVKNDLKKVVKVFKSTSTEPVGIVWDGKDDYYGATVANGDYDVELMVLDNAGNRSRAASNLKVYVPPKVLVKEVIREIIKEVKVKEESRGLVVNLSSKVLYGIGKAKLKPAAHRALDEVVNLLQSYSENEVLIEGHTDSIGRRETNMQLSSERAWAVYSYLVKSGIVPSRLKPKGYGSDKPIASNKTASGRAQNRRVEIIILKKEQDGLTPP